MTRQITRDARPSWDNPHDATWLAEHFEQIRAASRMAGFRTGTPPVAVPTAPLSPEETGVIPFRRATTEKVEVQQALNIASLTAGLQRALSTVTGNGYIFGLVLDVQAVTAANVAAVTFTEDAPWNALDSVILSDVAGELVNLSGFDLFLANLAGKQYAVDYADMSAQLFTLTPGGGATGGSFAFPLRVPVGLNRRTLTGIVGNQDRATKYDLRSDVAASGTIYTTAPTNLPGAGGNGSFTVDRYYEYYTVPAAEVTINGRRQAQEQLPPDYGRLHFITAADFEAAPSPGTRTFFLNRIGNTIRYIILVFRAGTGTTPRALAQANLPTAIDFKIGDDTIFHETWRYRQFVMGLRYGQNRFPNGVLVYDCMHDLLAGSGSEVGDDYYYTQGLNNAQFRITFPAGFTAGGTLHCITDDLQEVEPAA